MQANTKTIYPLTIVSDRYGGTYSGGRFTAWNTEPKDVPEDIYGNDVECITYWGNDSVIVCGIGDTPENAVAHLIERINRMQKGSTDNA